MPSFDAGLFASRRDAAVSELKRQGGGLMLVPAAEEKIRSHDSEFIFRQDNDFYFLTGFDEPLGCALLFADPPPGKPRFVLFVRPRDKEKEVWNGRRAGVEGAKQIFGADEAYPVEELDKRLPELVAAAGGPLWYRLGLHHDWDERVTRLIASLRARARQGVVAPTEVLDSGRILHEQRLVKNDLDLDRLRKACSITNEAHRAAMREARPGTHEYELQAEIEYAFRRRGGQGPGYGTIVAAGPNSCILHYRAGDAELRPGEVCLVDAGCEYDFYTADVTRTFPVSGKFTPAQRDLYQAVLEAQQAGIDAVKPGATVEAIHELTIRKLTEAMVGLKLLEGPVDARIQDQSFKRYYMHRTSHWLGMDVHDVGAYAVNGKPRPLAAGMVLTVEPGLYVGEEDEKAPRELRGVGVRIEDDILVTAAGRDNLTQAIPKTVAEVEAACVR